MTSRPGLTLTGRSLKTTAIAALSITIILASGGRGAWAAAFAIGSLTSLFSFGSLAILVPRIMHPAAPTQSKCLLMLTAGMKIPVFCAALWLASRLPGIAPFFTVPGIAAGPTAILMQVLKPVRAASAETAPREMAPRAAVALEGS